VTLVVLAPTERRPKNRPACLMRLSAAATAASPATQRMVALLAAPASDHCIRIALVTSSGILIQASAFRVTPIPSPRTTPTSPCLSGHRVVTPRRTSTTASRNSAPLRGFFPLCAQSSKRNQQRICRDEPSVRPIRVPNTPANQSFAESVVTDGSLNARARALLIRATSSNAQTVAVLGSNQ
jgi:hypothetical protein